MTMITPSYLGETIEYSSLHACRSTLEDPTPKATIVNFAWHMSQITCQSDEIPIPEWVPRNYGRLVLDDIKGSKEWLALPKISAEHALDNPIGANGTPVVDDKPPF